MRIRYFSWMFAMAAALCGCGEVDESVVLVLKNPPPVTTQPTTQNIPPGRVVAAGMLQVGDRFISAERILRDGREAFGQLARLTKEGDEAAFRAEARKLVDGFMKRAIMQCLVLTEADREFSEGIKAGIEGAVAYSHRRMVTMAGGSEELLLAKLRSDGLVLEELLADRRRMITINEYFKRKFRPKVRVTRKMLWRYYVGNRSEYRYGKVMLLRIIAAPNAAVPGGQGEAKKLVEAAAKAVKAKDGKSFAEVAKELGETISKPHGDKWPRMSFLGKSFVTRMISDGGLASIAMSPDSYADKALGQAAGKLKQGEISPITVTERCCYLILAEEVHPAADISFQDAQADIMDILIDDKISDLRANYINDLALKFGRIQGLSGDAMIMQFAAIILDRTVERFWSKGK